MGCPVCNQGAIDITKPDLDGRSIRCGSCGDYDITRTSIGKFTGANAKMRKQALAKAKRLAGDKQRPSIDSRCF